MSGCLKICPYLVEVYSVVDFFPDETLLFVFVHFSQENKDPPVPTVRQEPVLEAHNKKSENVHQKPTAEVSTRVGKDVMGFLQKLREAGQAKPTW